MVVGIIVLDAGVALQHISNQSTIYALRPGARSRLTTAYMTGHMVSGAIGSALASAAAWVAGGWSAVSIAGGCLATIGLLVWSLEPRLT